MRNLRRDIGVTHLRVGRGVELGVAEQLVELRRLGDLEGLGLDVGRESRKERGVVPARHVVVLGVHAAEVPLDGVPSRFDFALAVRCLRAVSGARMGRMNKNIAKKERKNLPCVVENKHHRDDAVADQDRKSLHGQLQAALAGDQDETLEISGLLGRDGAADGAARGVADAAVHGLRPGLAALGEGGAEDSDLGRSRLGDDEVAGSKEGREALSNRVSWPWRDHTHEIGRGENLRSTASPARSSLGCPPGTRASGQP